MPAFLLAALAALILFMAPAAAQSRKAKPENQKTKTETRTAKTESRDDMTFVALDAASLCDDCTIVQASGSFGEETISAYYDLVLRGGFKKDVYFVFHSPGGSMAAAIRLGEIMRNLKVKTVVGRAVVRNGEVEIEPGRCASACVFTFLGGATRSVPKDSKLGVHSWMPFGLLERVDDKGRKVKPRALDRAIIEALHRQTATYLKYLETMGVDLRLGVLILRTSHDSIAWVSPREQSLWSMVTADSSLSTPADRKWPILSLRPNPSPPPVESPTRRTAAAEAHP